MPYVKSNKTKAEISAIRSEAGRKGALAVTASGNRSGGRKSSLKMDTDPTTSLTVRETDSAFISKMSSTEGISKAAAVRLLILHWRATKGGVVLDQDKEKRLEETKCNFPQHFPQAPKA